MISADIKRLLKMHLSNSVSDEEGFVPIAKQRSQGTGCSEDTEGSTTKKMPLNKAITMAMSGEITDSMSLAGLMRLAIQRQRGASA